MPQGLFPQPARDSGLSLVRSLAVIFAVVPVIVVIPGAEFAMDLIQHHAHDIGAQPG